MRKRNRKLKVIGLAGMLVTGWVAGSLPAEPVSAANGWDVDLNAGGSVEASSVSITMGGATNGQLNAGSTDPNKSAGLVKRTASVEIGATDGYTVTLSGNPNLTGVNSSNKIPTVTSNTTLAQMNNQWGWYTAEGNVDCSALQTMKQMKSTGDQIAAGTLNAKTTKQFTMCFGAKVNGNQAADTYSNTVTLSVVAQPKVVQTFGGIKTMQEMTSDICKAASVNDTAYLRDTRDNKSYWVTKLADGNCWMSQNLDLDITTSNVKAADSDVTSDWNSSSSYPPVATVTNITELASGNDNTGSYSTEYIQNMPTATESCGGFSGVTSLDKCLTYGFLEVTSAYKASADPNFYHRELYSGTDGSICTKIANTAISTATSGPCAQYDAHFLVGNYYSWNAATAGTGGGLVNTRASGSICPKNWKLPSAGSSISGSFSYLLQQYGVSSQAVGTGTNNNLGTHGITYNVALSPLFFIRDGWADGSSHKIAYAGQMARYWSAVSRAAHDPYQLEVSTNTVSPDSSNNSYRGNSLRCFIPAS